MLGIPIIDEGCHVHTPTKKTTDSWVMFPGHPENPDRRPGGRKTGSVAARQTAWLPAVQHRRKVRLLT